MGQSGIPVGEWLYWRVLFTYILSFRIATTASYNIFYMLAHLAQHLVLATYQLHHYV